MNPVFWFLVILAMVAVWFGLRFLFRGIGGSFTNVINSTKQIMTDEEREDN